MARLGHLLSVLGLVLCGATGLGLSAPLAHPPRNPSSVVEAAGAGAGASVSRERALGRASCCAKAGASGPGNVRVNCVPSLARGSNHH